MTKKKDKCEICDHQLVYSIDVGDVKELQCYYCSSKYLADIWCPEGHYICDECHMKDPIKLMEDFCFKSDLKDPFIIADELMRHNKFKLYGPEHHILVPLAILTALRNNGIKKTSGIEISQVDLKEAIRRASKIPGGWCGFYGSCGAGIGSGIAISILTSATPGKDIPRTLANSITSRSLSKIADSLEHCCKRSVRLSLMEILKFLREKFDIKLNYTPQKCSFTNINDKCVKKNCFLY
ncbi:MAG: DUF5714 domain-containing protein [Promethearchaeota archaeon]